MGSFETTDSSLSSGAIEEAEQQNLRHRQSRELRASMGLAPELESTEDIERYIVSAQQNIETGRKQVITLEGLEPGAVYRVEQETSEFPFGTAVNFEMILEDKEVLLEKYPDRRGVIERQLGESNRHRQLYAETLGRYFNGMVGEITHKWDWMVYHGATDYSTTDKVMELLRGRPETLEHFRGHSIFWNRREYLPFRMREDSKEEILRALLEERLEILDRYPEIKEWDIINEPLRPHAGQELNRSEVVFDPNEDIDLLAELCKRAKEKNPQARLYVNEYGLLSGNNLREFIEFIQKLRERGAPIDGIGVQCHVADWDFASIAQLQENLDALATLELPIKITEFDVSQEVIERMYFPPGQRQKEKEELIASSPQEEIEQTMIAFDKAFDEKVERSRADYLRKALTIFYGHPAVEGVYLWGFQDRTHWRSQVLGEHAGLFDDDFQPNQVGEAFLQLVHGEWKTRTRVTADDQGRLTFKGFPGRYKAVKVESDE